MNLPTGRQAQINTDEKQKTDRLQGVRFEAEKERSGKEGVLQDGAHAGSRDNRLLKRRILWREVEKWSPPELFGDQVGPKTAREKRCGRP